MKRRKNETLESWVGRVLEPLGTTQVQALQVLRAEGVKGVPGEGCHCVIAEYITKHTELTAVVDPYDNTVLVHAPQQHPAEGTWLRLPPSLGRLAAKFDEGAFPELAYTLEEEEIAFQRDLYRRAQKGVTHDT